MQTNNKRKNPQSSQKQQKGPKRQRVSNAGYRNPGELLGRLQQEQVGNVVSTKLTKLGMSDIRALRIAWVAGFTFVGNGTNGTNLAVYFKTASGTYLIRGLTNYPSSGQVPVAASDADVGQTYLQDVLKHFARKVIKRAWIHIDSLQPSTQNNMMTVIGVSRGPGGAPSSLADPLATASVTPNSVPNVSSMKGAFTVDSWESRCVEITDMIAGGAGARQNEFESQSLEGGSSTLYPPGGGPIGKDVLGQVPCCFAVAGNCTTTTLENTNVHQISIELEIDLLDYIGGMNLVNADS